MYEGRVAVITGAGGGIGYGYAHACAKEGMKLVLTAYHPERLEQNAEALRKEFGVEVATITGDMTKEEDVKKVAQFALDTFGEVYMAFINAGVHFHKSFHLLTDTDWEFMLRSNFWSVIYGIRTFRPILHKNHDSGHIISTAALASLTPTPTMSHYTAAKAANLGMTECVQLEEWIYHPENPVQLHIVMPAATTANLMFGAKGIRDSEARFRNDTEEQTEVDKKFEVAFHAMVDWDLSSKEAPQGTVHAFDAGDLVIQQVKEGRNYIYTDEFVRETALRMGNIYAGGYMSKEMLPPIPLD